MSQKTFPWIAATLGLVLLGVLFAAGGLTGDGQPKLPALTLLFICEFGFLVTGAGIYFAARRWLTQRSLLPQLLLAFLCALLALAFSTIGFMLWERISG